MGSKQAGGMLSAALATNERGDRVTVTAGHMTGVQVDVSREDARAFAYGLLQMLGDR